MTKTIGCLVIDVQGKELSAEERELLSHPLVGGVILFTRNFDSRQQLELLCQEMRQARHLPLCIMADQEGGRVQRFASEFTRLPSMASFGSLFEQNKQAANAQAEQCGYLMASELLATGIDLSLSPVLDLNKSVSSVIGDRAFHADPQVVAILASAFIQGMKKAGMAAVGKHFPGHGSVTADSHLALPIDQRSIGEIEQADLQPFATLIANDIPALMAAHIVFPQVDHLPVGFSRTWLMDILRQRLGFAGSVLSDDLSMEGANISANYDDRVHAAREAGCDFTLICNNRKGVIQALDRLPAAKHQIEEAKWRQLIANAKVNLIH